MYHICFTLSTSISFISFWFQSKKKTKKHLDILSEMIYCFTLIDDIESRKEKDKMAKRQKKYTVEEIRLAFVKMFQASGEWWFSYFAEDDTEVNDTFADFLKLLEEGEKENG